MIKKKYLPLGSIVLLEGATKRIMIAGYFVKSDDKIYDYCGCLYPEGFLSSDSCLLFNHDQIKKVYYFGYSDNEDKEFKDRLKDFVNGVK